MKNGKKLTLRITSQVSGDDALEFVFEKPALRIDTGSEEPTIVSGYLHNVGRGNSPVQVHCEANWQPSELAQYITVSDSFCDTTIVLVPSEKKQLSLQMRFAKYIPLSNDIITYRMLAKVQR